jgi:hypothetical protein
VHRSLASLFVVQCTGCIGTRFFVHTEHHTATCVNASGPASASLAQVVTELLRPLGVPHNNHTKAGWLAGHGQGLYALAITQSYTVKRCQSDVPKLVIRECTSHRAGCRTGSQDGQTAHCNTAVGWQSSVNAYPVNGSYSQSRLVVDSSRELRHSVIWHGQSLYSWRASLASFWPAF